MILYNKSGDFLGIGKDELSFLGYDDLDEFKSIHNDVADLFVNRPGYIFKFKNFSWIDYALHSGAPKKSVIIKLKTGNEVEVAIKIKELFLYDSKENEDLYYSIEFINDVTQNHQLQNESNFTQLTPSAQIPKSKVTENDTNVNTFEEKKEPAEVSFEKDFVEEIEEEISADFNTMQEEKEPLLKLKIDDTIFDAGVDSYLKKENNIDINDDFTADYVQEEPLRLKTDISTEDAPFKPIEEINSNDIQEEPPRLKTDISTEDAPFKPIEEINSNDIQENQEEQTNSNMQIFNTIDLDSHKNEENVDFNLYECVDELGLDISLIGELITDYMTKIDKTLPAFKTSIEDNNEVAIKNNIYELKGISDSLHMQQLSNILVCIFKETNSNSRKLELEKFANIVAKFKRELI